MNREAEQSNAAGTSLESAESSLNQQQQLLAAAALRLPFPAYQQLPSSNETGLNAFLSQAPLLQALHLRHQQQQQLQLIASLQNPYLPPPIQPSTSNSSLGQEENSDLNVYRDYLTRLIQLQSTSTTSNVTTTSQHNITTSSLLGNSLDATTKSSNSGHEPSIKKESPSSSKKVSRESLSQSRDKVFTCKICFRSFGYKHVLQNHERTHTGEKPFECKVCHKRFTRDHHLKTHMRLHTGEKPYSCSHCERQFVQVANLRRHLRVHTGEKPYKCEVCDSCFSDSNQLKAHVLIHKGEKPFNCELCNGKFRRRHHLMHHACSKEGKEGIETLQAERSRQRKAKEPKKWLNVMDDSSAQQEVAKDAPVQTEPEDLSKKIKHSDTAKEIGYVT